MPVLFPKEDHIKNELIELNNAILAQSSNQFDFSNFNGYIESEYKITNIEGVIRGSSIQFKGFLLDETREKYKELLRLCNDEESLQIIKKLLTRDVLFFGSECEELGLIDIVQEYKDLKEIINDEYLKIHKSNNQTKDGFIDTWSDVKPEIVVISCHGSEYGLFLKDENGKCKEYNNSNFYNFFKKRSDYTECVILSSCSSINLGKLIADYGRNVVCINRKVKITEAKKYINEFFKYLNKYSSKNNSVYENAHKSSLEKLEFDSSSDSFSFEFLKANKIEY